MAPSALIFLLALPLAASRQLTLSDSASALQLAERAAHEAARSTAEFLDGLSADLQQLEGKLSEAEPKSLLQLSAEPQAKKAEPHQAKGKDVDVQAAVKQMAALSNQAGSMPAMAGLLEGMYDTWKEKIGTANKREKEQKKAFDATMKEIELKKAKAKANGADTKTYDNIEKYWKRQREIAHRQYHTALKIMHSGMEKFKGVKAAMDNAIAGKKPTQGDLRAVGMAAPDVVLLQLSAWARDASAQLAGARELRADTM